MENKTYGELNATLSGCPTQGKRFRHYKGGKYVIVGAAVLEFTQEPLVLYVPFGRRGPVFARPLTEFAASVLVNGELVPRFREIK